MALRVVLIQSEMQSAQPLTRFFSQRGDEVWQAWELGQAWELLLQVKPHLILMDLHIASAEWVLFLRRVRQRLPETQVIMTNKYPDLQREMLAREQNVRVFLRQPFTARWIDQALKRLQEAHPAGDTPREDAFRAGGSTVEKTGQSAVDARLENRRSATREMPTGTVTRRVRVPVRVKITLPYLLLTLVFALGGAYLISRVVLESV